MHPNPNLFQPGPALLFVVMSGIPSNGTYVLIGSGNIEPQPTAGPSVLPANVLEADAKGSASPSENGSGSGSGNGDPATTSSSTSHVALYVGIAGGAAVVALLALGVWICLARRRRARIRAGIAASKAALAASGAQPYAKVESINDSQVYLDQQHHQNDSRTWSQPGTPTWNASTPSFAPYHDCGDMTPVSAHPPAHYNEAGGHYDASAHYDYQQQPHY